MSIEDVNFAIEVLSHPQSGDESDINMALDIAIKSLKAWRENTARIKTGHWVEIEPYPLQMHDYECSECGHETNDNWENYCSNCGAKMFEPQESEDKE